MARVFVPSFGSVFFYFIIFSSLRLCHIPNIRNCEPLIHTANVLRYFFY